METMSAEDRLRELIRRLEIGTIYNTPTPTVLEMRIATLREAIRELAFLVLKLDNERHGK